MVALSAALDYGPLAKLTPAQKRALAVSNIMLLDAEPFFHNKTRFEPLSCSPKCCFSSEGDMHLLTAVL